MKLKILSFVLVCLLLLVGCGTKFNDAKASSIIKEAFELTKEDTLKDLETFMESENIALVKFKLNEFELSAKIRRYVDSGWQLDEIQTYKLGEWISAEDAIKWFISSREESRAYQRAREEEEEEEMRARKEQPQMYAMKDAMNDIRAINTALADFISDNGHAPDQNGTYNEDSELYKSLSPYYIKVTPIKDPWGNNYRVYCGKACDRRYGIFGSKESDHIVISYGRDGKKEAWEFDANNPEAGLYDVKNKKDLNKDFIMLNGRWIRAPRKEY